MPASSPELVYTPAHVLRDLIAAKRLSPVELMQFTLDRIERLDNSLGAFVTVMADHAMSEARAAEEAVMQGREVGPLHGVPVPIKDLEAVAGVRLSQGSLVNDGIAESNAMCTDRVRAAGAIIVGKTNTPEHGHNATTENRVFGPARNPWDPARTPGGSSGGSAVAVAAGITAIAQGSDGGGSIRIPGSLSGIYGIKATQGRVPRKHVDEHSYSFFNNSSVGPMTWDVRDAAIFLNVLAGPAGDAEYGTLPDDPPDFTAALARGVAGLRIGLDTSGMGGAGCDPEVREAVAAAARAFAELGAHVDEGRVRPGRARGDLPDLHGPLLHQSVRAMERPASRPGAGRAAHRLLHGGPGTRPARAGDRLSHLHEQDRPLQGVRRAVLRRARPAADAGHRHHGVSDR